MAVIKSMWPYRFYYIIRKKSEVNRTNVCYPSTILTHITVWHFKFKLKKMFIVLLGISASSIVLLGITALCSASSITSASAALTAQPSAIQS